MTSPPQFMIKKLLGWDEQRQPKFLLYKLYLKSYIGETNSSPQPPRKIGLSTTLQGVGRKIFRGTNGKSKTEK